MIKEIFQNRSVRFKVGICLTVLFSAIIGFFNFVVLYWFGIPIFGLLSGLIVIWFSPESIKIKLISTFIPLPITLCFFFLFYLLLPKAEPETFIIPQNFRGELQVIFDEPCGQPVAYKDGRRIYQIPVNGILITSSKRTTGVINRKFYSIDENENLTAVPEYDWSNYGKEKDEWRWMFSNSEFTYDSIGIFWAYHNCFCFIVSNFRFMESETREQREEKAKRFFYKSDLLLKQCRQTS